MFSPQPLGKWETAHQKLTFKVKNPVEALIETQRTIQFCQNILNLSRDPVPACLQKVYTRNERQPTPEDEKRVRQGSSRLFSSVGDP
jgi:hypothetical protein